MMHRITLICDLPDIMFNLRTLQV